MATKILNLDDGDEDEAPKKALPFEWKGRTWHLLNDFNAFAFGQVQVAAPEDRLGAFVSFFRTLVIEDEREDWARFLVEHNFSMEQLSEKMKRLLEAMGKDDTKSPPASSATPVRKTSARRSTVSSSSIRDAGPKG